MEPTEPTEPTEPPDDVPNAEPVPKLPRGKGFKFSKVEVIRIAMLGSVLVAVVVLQRPCADSTSRFIDSFESRPDAAPPPVAPANGNYIRLTGEITEDELRRHVEGLRDAGTGSVNPDPSTTPQ